MNASHNPSLNPFPAGYTCEEVQVGNLVAYLSKTSSQGAPYVWVKCQGRDYSAKDREAAIKLLRSHNKI